MKPFVVMMAGLPGSGKSTFAERYVTVNGNKPVVLSTDKLREELYGDPSIQGNYKTLFDEVYRRLRNHLKNGEHVIFDATNIKKEHRKIFFDNIADIECVPVCVVMVADKDISKSRNSRRKRVVPSYVIDRMADSWEEPVADEGFENIVFISPTWESHNLDFFVNFSGDADYKVS